MQQLVSFLIAVRTSVWCFSLCAGLRHSALSIPLQDKPELHGNFLSLPLQLGLLRKLYWTGEENQGPPKKLLDLEGEWDHQCTRQNFFHRPLAVLQCGSFPTEIKQRVQDHSLTHTIDIVRTQNWDLGIAPRSVSLGVTTVLLRLHWQFLSEDKKWLLLTNESQNHTISEARRYLWRLSSSSPLLKARSARPGCLGHHWVGFEYLQGWRLYNVSGQSVLWFYQS